MTPKEKVLRRYPKAFATYGRLFSRRRGMTEKLWKIWRPTVLVGGPEPLSPGMRTARAAWWIAALQLALTGCASTLQIPKTVNVAVPVACLTPADRPERPPLLTDAELLALDSYRFTWALWGDRLEALGYVGKLEAIVEGCSRIPAVKP